MIDERIEEKVTAKPDWFDMSEPKRLLWTCCGTGIGEYSRGGAQARLSWMPVFTTKEEAEADAYSPRTYWVWDEKPASPYRLADMMAKARRQGRPGVRVRSYRDGKWITVAEYPSNVPLQGDE